MILSTVTGFCPCQKKFFWKSCLGFIDELLQDNEFSFSYLVNFHDKLIPRWNRFIYDTSTAETYGKVIDIMSRYNFWSTRINLITWVSLLFNHSLDYSNLFSKIVRWYNGSSEHNGKRRWDFTSIVFRLHVRFYLCKSFSPGCTTLPRCAKLYRSPDICIEL